MFLIYDGQGRPETIVQGTVEDAVLEALDDGAEEVVVDAVDVDGRETNPRRPDPDLALDLLRRPDGSEIRVTDRAYCMSFSQAADELRQVAEGLLGGRDWFEVFSQKNDPWKNPVGMRNWLLRPNDKLEKGMKSGLVAIFGLSLVPHRILASDDTFGYYPHGTQPQRYPNFCAGASNACSRSCLVYSGQQMLDNSVFPKFAAARMFVDATDAFVCALRHAVDAFYRPTFLSKFKYKGLRLNAISDIPWERIVPDLRKWFRGRERHLYDYTKIIGRNPGSWYDLTFSYSGQNLHLCKEALENGQRIAVVVHNVGFKTNIYGEVVKDEKVREQLARHRYKPIHFLGMRLRGVNGDRHDARFLDPKPSVVFLHWKAPTLRYKLSDRERRKLPKEVAAKIDQQNVEARLEEYRLAIKRKFVVEVQEVEGLLLSAVTPSEQPDEIGQSVTSLDPIDVKIDDLIRTGRKRRTNPDRIPRVYRAFRGRCFD